MPKTLGIWGDAQNVGMPISLWHCDTAISENHRQPKLTSRERIRLIISGVRAGTWLFNESGIGLHGGREFIKAQVAQAHYVWVRASEVIWSELSQINVAVNENCFW